MLQTMRWRGVDCVVCACVCVCVCVRVRIVRVVFSLYVDASDGSAFDVCSQCVDCVFLCS